MIRFLAFALLLTLGLTPLIGAFDRLGSQQAADQPQPAFGLDNAQTDSLNVMMIETVSTDQERFACLLGTVDGDVVRVDHIVRPEQHALKTSAGWYVVAGECPAGTVADFHTHPVGGVQYPSIVDFSTWDQSPYDIHLIAHLAVGPAGEARVWIQPWVRVSGTPYFTVLVRQW